MRKFVSIFIVWFFAIIQIIAGEVMGYRLDKNMVVFEYIPQAYSDAFDASGKKFSLSSQVIDSVFVACEVNGWLFSEWKMKKINASAYELRISRNEFADKERWEFKFVVNGKYWAEPPIQASNTAVISKSWQSFLFRSSVKSRNYVLTVPQPAEAIRFFLPKYLSASKVILAGEFNNWNEQSTKMAKTPAGWEATLLLKPGIYNYKFIVDGTWITDPTNQNAVYDGKGNQNSMLVVPSRNGNTEFTLNGFASAQTVALAGTFNGWNPFRHFFWKENAQWKCRVNIRPGLHQYKFVVDGSWITDPMCSESLPNDEGNTNSVLAIPAMHGNTTFRLKGYSSAKRVFLSGTFNSWSETRHLFGREGKDWICRINLEPGTYRYKFIVDGNWILDPANSWQEPNEHGTGNSVIRIP